MKSRVFIDYNQDDKLFKYYYYDDEGKVWKKPNSSSRLSEEHFTHTVLDIIDSELIGYLIKEYNPGNNGLIIEFYGEAKDYETLKRVLEEQRNGRDVAIHHTVSYANPIKDNLIPPPAPKAKPLKVKIMIRLEDEFLIYENKSWNTIDRNKKNKDKKGLELSSVVSTYKPDILVLPDGCNKSTSCSHTIHLNDFAAYLWYRSTMHQNTLSDNFTLIVIDYFGGDQYAQSYVMNSKNVFKSAGNKVFHDLRSKKHMEKDLYELCGKKYDYAFRTFSVSKHDGTTDRLEEIGIHDELQTYIKMLCGENAENELKQLLEYFNLDLMKNTDA